MSYKDEFFPWELYNSIKCIELIKFKNRYLEIRNYFPQATMIIVMACKGVNSWVQLSEPFCLISTCSSISSLVRIGIVGQKISSMTI